MRLGETLRNLRTVLETKYGLTDIQFKDNFVYGSDRRIPGFSFNIRSPSQIHEIDKLYCRVQTEVMEGMQDVTCYLMASNQKLPTYREVHVIIKSGEPFAVLKDLTAKLTEKLEQFDLAAFSAEHTKTS